MHFNGQTFSGAFEQFSFTLKFLWLKMQKSTFLRKNDFESSFYKKEVYVVTNWSVWLNSPVASGKIVKCTEFYFEHSRPNTVELD